MLPSRKIFSLQSLAFFLAKLSDFPVVGENEPNKPILSRHPRAREPGDGRDNVMWANSENPYVKFYLEHCPWESDVVLTVAARFSLGDIVSATQRVVFSSIRKAFQGPKRRPNRQM